MTPTAGPANGSSRGSSRGRKVGTYLHILAYRLTGGLLGGNLALARCLLLTTTGRKTGQRHTVPLAYFMDGGERYVVASNWGSDRHAAWYLNALADPHVEVQVGRGRSAALAVVATPEERARLWPGTVARMPVFARYQAGIDREIPLVFLQPLHS